jgi:hypothetical protein
VWKRGIEVRQREVTSSGALFVDIINHLALSLSVFTQNMLYQCEHMQERERESKRNKNGERETKSSENLID